MGKFNEALAAVDTFLLIKNLGEKSIKAADYRKQCYQFAIDYAARHSNNNYVFAPQNLGDSINSKESEYYPSFTIDDSTFVFTRRGEAYAKTSFKAQKPGMAIPPHRLLTAISI